MGIMKNAVRYLTGLATVLVLRLIPHPPNVEPIMATMMPYAKRWGILSGILFTVIAMAGYDLLTGTLGVWSILTIGTYTLLAIAAGWYFRRAKPDAKHFVGFAVIGTLVYDAITGIGTGMLFFHQSFAMTFYGQIPFTLYHLAGNIVLAGIVSPLLYRWVLANPETATDRVWHHLRSLFRTGA